MIWLFFGGGFRYEFGDTGFGCFITAGSGLWRGRLFGIMELLKSSYSVREFCLGFWPTIYGIVDSLVRTPSDKLDGLSTSTVPFLLMRDVTFDETS